MSHRELVQSSHLSQMQRLILSPHMRKALHLLQLPLPELSSVIEEELSQNPLLEYAEESSFGAFRSLYTHVGKESEDLKAFAENTLVYEASLYDHLMSQANELFVLAIERQAAEALIGNFNRQGFLSAPMEEIAQLSEIPLKTLEGVLAKIQQFEPLGVGARDLRESLLIQLSGKGQSQTLAYQLVENHFDDILHNRLPLISKALKVPVDEIRSTITNEIARLDLHPGGNEPEGHYKQLVHYITPDVTIHADGEKVAIEINEEGLPPFRLNPSYLRLLEDPTIGIETKDYLKEKILSGKWLMRNLFERNQTLYRITEQLAEKQKDYLLAAGGKLLPLTMKEVATTLSLHESTIARAVASKYISCPRGILPLRSFFTHAIVTTGGASISSKTIKELLLEIIRTEDKKNPLSDEAISGQIKNAGIPCARRTVAKYRGQLGIGNTLERKMH